MEMRPSSMMSPMNAMMLTALPVSASAAKAPMIPQAGQHRPLSTSTNTRPTNFSTNSASPFRRGRFATRRGREENCRATPG